MRTKPYFLTLLELTKKGANKEFVSISTTELSLEIGLTQQAISKHMLDMEREELIIRRKLGKETKVMITEKGKEVLYSVFVTLKQAIEGGMNEVKLRGRVFTGIGEGAYYVSLSGYREQFIKKLGFEPYPGTLNLRLEEPYVELRRQLKVIQGIQIDGFVSNGRSFGGAKCFKAIINNKSEGAALLVERTHYGENVIELISRVRLRDELKLRDGDLVNVKVILT